MAVFHSFIWHPRCVINIGYNCMSAVSLYRLISTFVCKQCSVLCTCVFKCNCISCRRIDVSAGCQSCLFICVFHSNASFYHIDERFDAFSSKCRIASVFMYCDQVIRKSCSHSRRSKNGHITVLISRDCIFYNSVWFNYCVASHFYNGSCIKKIFAISCLTI